MSEFLSEKLSKLKPYVPGEQPKERKYIKLNTNESPFPPSKKAIDLISEQSSLLNLYPDPDVKELTGLVAKECGVNPEVVMLWVGHESDNDVKTSRVDRGYTTYSDDYLLSEINKIHYEYE